MWKRSSGSVRVCYPKSDTEAVVASLKERVGELQRCLPLRMVVLFGSYARGSYTVASDIDLLVVYEDPPREDAYITVRQALDLPRLEPHVYSQAEYRRQQRVVDRMMAGGIYIYPEPT